MTLVSTHISLFRTDGVRTSQQCVCIYTAVYSQTLTAISIFKYVNIVCIIQVHTARSLCRHHLNRGARLEPIPTFEQIGEFPLNSLIQFLLVDGCESELFKGQTNLCVSHRMLVILRMMVLLVACPPSSLVTGRLLSLLFAASSSLRLFCASRSAGMRARRAVGHGDGRRRTGAPRMTRVVAAGVRLVVAGAHGAGGAVALGLCGSRWACAGCLSLASGHRFPTRG